MLRALHFAILSATLIVMSPALSPVVVKAASAAEQGKEKKKEKVDITADDMQVYEKDNKVLFIGNVKAIKGETTLYADKLEVFTEKEKQPDGSEKTKVRRLIATGHVRIVKPKVTITGEKANMDVKKDEVVVTGNVVVKKPDATIQGDKLIANLKTDVTRVVTGGKKKVHGVFNQ